MNKKSSHVPIEVRRLGTGAARAFVSFLSKQRTSNTRQSYSNSVCMFCKWLGGQRKSTDDIGLTLLYTYFTNLIETRTLRTARAHLAALRGFFEVMVANGLLLSNPADNIRVDYQEESLCTQSLEPSRLKQILDLCDGPSLRELRVQCLIRLLVEGATCQELVRVRACDCIEKNGRRYLMLTSEGKASRLFPLFPVTATYLDRFMAAAGLSCTDEIFIFRGMRKGMRMGYYTSASPMTGQNMNKLLARTAKRVGFEDELTTTVLRATGIRLNLRAGLSVMRIACQYGIRTDQVVQYMYTSTDSVLYEGDIDGLLLFLSDSSSGPLGEFIEKRGIFRLSIRAQEGS